MTAFQTHEPAHVPENVRVAIIAAAAAIAGALVGGIATYAGNQAILGEQLDREERKQKIAARGVGRVYAEQIRSADIALRYDAENGRWAGKNQLSSFELPALEDRRLIQSRLSPQDSSLISSTDQVMREVTSIIYLEPDRRLSNAARPEIAADIATLDKGEGALAQLDK
jgi:hypothetical protein